MAHYYGEENISTFFSPFAVKAGKRMKYNPITQAVTSDADDMISELTLADPDMDFGMTVEKDKTEANRAEIFEKQRLDNKPGDIPQVILAK